MLILLRQILIPLSFLFRLTVHLRNYLYDKGIIKTYVSPVKIISTGNISAGGSGKTPLVIYIASGLLSGGSKIAIISRGYRRKSKGLNIVYDGKKITSDINNSGDEAYMTVKSLLDNYSGFYFLTSENRIEAVKYIEKHFKADFIILDDAFQHRKIHRDKDIIVIDSNDFIKRNFLNKFLLPAGNLREPFKNIKRASVIVQNDKVYSAETISRLKNMHIPVFHSNYSLTGIFNHNSEVISINNKEVLAFSGLANPDSFLDLIKINGGVIYNKILFPDHHGYTLRDIERIKRCYKKDTIIITTEKDFVKISEFDGFVNNYPVYYMKIGLHIKNENEFFSLLTA